MISKRMLIGALVLLNAVLLTAVFLVAHTPPMAIAQEPGEDAAAAPAPAGGLGDTIVIAAQADAGNDVIYLFDSRNMVLHAFRSPFPRMGGQTVDIAYVGWRDLSGEFQRPEGRRR